MTANDFRRFALSFPETEERVHMNHPDFRVAGKIFATLGYPEDGWAMVKLTPLEQRSEEHTSELQSRSDLVCRLLLEKKKKKKKNITQDRHCSRLLYHYSIFTI